MCVCAQVCMSVRVCQLARSWRTGAPLPRQHFLVINDFFLPSCSLSLSLSLLSSVSFSFKLMASAHFASHSHDRGGLEQDRLKFTT